MAALQNKNRCRAFRTTLAMKLSRPRTSARASSSRIRSPSFHSPFSNNSPTQPRAEKRPPSPNGTSGNKRSTIQTSPP
eukprot:5143177-Pyramimonas_sp.AAC.1